MSDHKMCGTCRWWGSEAEKSAEEQWCECPPPPPPFPMNIMTNPSAFPYKRMATDGTLCLCWEAKEAKEVEG